MLKKIKLKIVQRPKIRKHITTVDASTAWELDFKVGKND